MLNMKSESIFLRSITRFSVKNFRSLGENSGKSCGFVHFMNKNTLEKVSFLLVRFLWTSKENEHKQTCIIKLELTKYCIELRRSKI
jgi:hypothetical protein